MLNFSLKDRTRFMKKLAFLLESGISFLQALHFIEEREEKPKIKKYLRDVALRIRGGMPLHKSFRIKPFLVDEQSLCLIESGEATGTLSKNCMRLGNELDARLVDKNKMISTLVYPIFILLFTLILVVALLVFVFPKILPLLLFGDTPLPFSTRFLISLSSIVKEYGLYVLILIFMFVGSIVILLKKRPSLRIHVDKLLLRVPFISKIIRLRKTSSLCRVLALFLDCGHTLSESLYYVEKFERNLVYKKDLALITKRIHEGLPFSKILVSYLYLFPKETPHFVALGEESGNLSKTLFHISLMYEEELNEIKKRLFTLLEPALMLFIGILVGGIALSLVSPLYSITSLLSQNTP
jgi:type II secretory pathway component PulF